MLHLLQRIRRHRLIHSLQREVVETGVLRFDVIGSQDVLADGIQGRPLFVVESDDCVDHHHGIRGNLRLLVVFLRFRRRWWNFVIQSWNRRHILYRHRKNSSESGP